jgi:hypothetical protein
MGAVTRAATVQVSWVCVRVRVCVCVFVYIHIYMVSKNYGRGEEGREKVCVVCLSVCLSACLYVCV